MGKKWTLEETEFLKQNYDRMFRGELAKALNKTKAAIKNKNRKLGLKRTLYGNTEINWTEQEKKFMLENYGRLTALQVAEVLGQKHSSVKNFHRAMKLTGSKVNTKYSFNKRAFSEFTSESCYWAGFLAAD